MTRSTLPTRARTAARRGALDLEPRTRSTLPTRARRRFDRRAMLALQVNLRAWQSASASARWRAISAADRALSGLAAGRAPGRDAR